MMICPHCNYSGPPLDDACPMCGDGAETAATEDYRHLAALLRANLNNSSFRAILSNNFNIILAALDLAAGAETRGKHHD